VLHLTFKRARIIFRNGILHAHRGEFPLKEEKKRGRARRRIGQRRARPARGKVKSDLGGGEEGKDVYAREGSPPYLSGNHLFKKKECPERI